VPSNALWGRPGAQQAATCEWRACAQLMAMARCALMDDLSANNSDNPISPRRQIIGDRRVCQSEGPATAFTLRSQAPGLARL